MRMNVTPNLIYLTLNSAVFKQNLYEKKCLLCLEKKSTAHSLVTFYIISFLFFLFCSVLHPLWPSLDNQNQVMIQANTFTTPSQWINLTVALIYNNKAHRNGLMGTEQLNPPLSIPLWEGKIEKGQ